MLVFASCESETIPPAEDQDPAATSEPPATAAVDPIDPTIGPAIAGEDGWNYHQSADVDLDGDGESERAVLTARVELYRGQPAWDDGQPWQVYVEFADGSRTYLYAQRLQFGMLTMRVARDSGTRPAAIVLLEHLPDRMRLFEATSMEAGRAVSLRMVYERDLDARGQIAAPTLP